ncbi:MAG: ATP-binding cassette domain-containing protein, partial [Acutalibacteraceae bacterium]|nr:ATP-binding cassette domain-containing protein [Acutalibacteraceae bacterium]
YYAGVPYAKRYERAKQALAAVGLLERINHKPNQLSGGQQQRVSAARALVTEPKIILADEPTGNLDSRSGAALFNMLKSLNSSGRTLVLITHDMQLARQADRMIEIADGKVVRQ